jgi:hypothetical protein
MRWRLLRAPPSLTFITSDRPVHVVDPRATTAEHHLQSPGAMFTLPLTNNILLLGDWGGRPSMSWADITSAGVRDANLRRTAPGLKIYASQPDFLGHAELLELERGEIDLDDSLPSAPPNDQR